MPRIQNNNWNILAGLLFVIMGFMAIFVPLFQERVRSTSELVDAKCRVEKFQVFDKVIPWDNGYEERSFSLTIKTYNGYLFFVPPSIAQCFDTLKFANSIKPGDILDVKVARSEVLSMDQQEGLKLYSVAFRGESFMNAESVIKLENRGKEGGLPGFIFMGLGLIFLIPFENIRRRGIKKFPKKKGESNW